VAISVYDVNGGFVNSFETGPLNSGRQSAAWDGTDRNGNPVSAGLYRFEVQAVKLRPPVSSPALRRLPSMMSSPFPKFNRNPTP
jgi:flagellar hook assembly protein FlgD